MKYQNVWDMASVFSGGSDSPDFYEKIKRLNKDLIQFNKLVENWDIKEDSPNFVTFKTILNKREKLVKGLNESRTFMSGLAAANMQDTKAQINLNILSNLSTKLNNIFIILQKKIAKISDAEFNELLKKESFKESAFRLKEIRKKAKKLLSTKEEELLNNLSIDGFEAWGDMYNELVKNIEVVLEEDGQRKSFSAGQAENKINAEENYEKRQQMLKIWEEAWKEKADLFANTLNHLAGFRLADQKAHGIEDFMTPPLEYNRMNSETLDTMWDTISENKGKVLEYFDRKSKLLGTDRLSWLDITASINLGDYDAKKYTFTEAANFIIKNFDKTSPKMAKLAEQAFSESWIEAEDRPGKRPGGYCANLPESEESRIFMTFSGSSDNVSTLAHELGHAFHSSVLRDLPLLNQDYAMNVAETASTFAELIVADATIQNAESREEKINLLDQKISQSAVMMMNIHARYLFEKSFYEERTKGIVSAERLSELMLKAQKEAYVNSLETYHPMFWAAKLHFYNTGVPFYNFPYTFGYFFSLGIYARAIDSADHFEEDYISLLRDTANMSTEDLAKKHLDVNLRKTDFWQNAINKVHEDIDYFLELTEDYL